MISDIELLEVAIKLCWFHPQSNKYLRFALKAVMKSYSHSEHPKDWKINRATGNGHRMKASMKKTPEGVTFWPRTGPYDPLYIRLYLGQYVSIFFACPCSEKAFKYISASDHWNSQTHKKFIAKHKECTVKHAYYFNQLEHREEYKRTKSYSFLGQPNIHGEKPKRTKRRFGLDVPSEDTDEDMEFVPDAKKAKRSPSPPLPVRTMRTRIHQNYQKSTDSSSSDDGDALEEKMSVSSSPDLQDQYSSASHDEYSGELKQD